MAELEALVKQLTQVVSTLQELQNKKGITQATLEPEPRLKKTPEMSYNDFVKKALANRKPV